MVGGDGTYAPEPAVKFETHYKPRVDYNCYEGESFKYGGYNVTKMSNYDFSGWADILLYTILGIYDSLHGFPFCSVAALLAALGKTPKADPTYIWNSKKFVFDCSGFFEYDFHVEPDTTFGTSWLFAFGGNGYWMEGPLPDDYWRIYLDGWHSPPGPAVLELEPEGADWEDVGVGDSETKEFTLENTGEASVVIDVKIEGADAQDFDQVSGPMHWTMKPDDVETIGIRFRPTSPGFKSATLKIDADECDDVSAWLEGRGKKTRSANVVYSNFLKWLAERSLLLEKLLMLTIFKNL